MFTIRKSIFLSALLIAGMFFLANSDSGYSQESVSLGCCKTVEGTPACEGCGDGGLKCAIDGSFCPETSNFSLGQVCAESPVAGQAECYDPQTSGCCVTAQTQCSDDVNFNSCTGQHWFEGTACSAIPQCGPSAKSSGFIDWVILAAAFVVVIFLLMKFRRRRHGS